VVHNVKMRTSITLDGEVYSFVSAYAEAKGISLSAAISELVRRAEKDSEPASDSSRLKTSPHGYLVIAGTGDVLTSEMVKQASEDELV
jgi:macrodomain Ter protein organizer (MatP/YcbG family)